MQWIACKGETAVLQKLREPSEAETGKFESWKPTGPIFFRESFDLDDRQRHLRLNCALHGEPEVLDDEDEGKCVRTQRRQNLNHRKGAHLGAGHLPRWID